MRCNVAVKLLPLRSFDKARSYHESCEIECIFHDQASTHSHIYLRLTYCIMGEILSNLFSSDHDPALSGPLDPAPLSYSLC